jgi:hypothetical protein
MEVCGQLHVPGRFTPRERAPGILWIGGWAGPRAGLDAVVRRKNFQPLQGLNLATRETKFYLLQHSSNERKFTWNVTGSSIGKQRSWSYSAGLYDGYSNAVPAIHFFQAEHRIQFRSRPMRFLDFSNNENGAPGQKISKWSTVCNTFWRSGWSVVRRASLAKGGTSKETVIAPPQSSDSE